MSATSLDTAVILARGLGKRMRAADETDRLDADQAAVAETGLKAMIPIGRPFLDYSLSALADAGYRRMVLVIGPEHDLVRDYYGRQLRPQRLTIQFATQLHAHGTADAVLAAEPVTGDGPFLVINSDNYYPRAAVEALRQAAGPAVALFERDALVAGSNIPAERIVKFGVGEIDTRGCLQRIVEKPDEQLLATWPRPLWVSMNCWRFSPLIFAACRAIPLSARKEYELPLAVQYAIDTLGAEFRVLPQRAAVLDLSCRADIATVAARLAGVEVRL